MNFGPPSAGAAASLEAAFGVRPPGTKVHLAAFVGL
jgi:hypothetical protein